MGFMRGQAARFVPESRPTHLLAIHAESEECADEEVDGDAWVAGFHLGDAGLARTDEVGDVGV
jgi:hypothetical protein